MPLYLFINLAKLKKRYNKTNKLGTGFHNLFLDNPKESSKKTLILPI